MQHAWAMVAPGRMTGVLDVVGQGQLCSILHEVLFIWAFGATLVCSHGDGACEQWGHVTNICWGRYGPGHGPAMLGARKADISNQVEPEVTREAFTPESLASSSSGLHPPEARPRPRSQLPGCTEPASSPEQQAAASERSSLASASAQGPVNDLAATSPLASRHSEMPVSRGEATFECSAVGDPASGPAEGFLQLECGLGEGDAVVCQSPVWVNGSGAAVDGLREGLLCRSGSPIDVRGPLQSQIAKSH